MTKSTEAGLKGKIRKAVTGICWNPQCSKPAICLKERNEALDQILSLFRETIETVLLDVRKYKMVKDNDMSYSTMINNKINIGYNQAVKEQRKRFKDEVIG